jgi:hypothetical protein
MSSLSGQFGRMVAAAAASRSAALRCTAHALTALRVSSPLLLRHCRGLSTSAFDAAVAGVTGAPSSEPLLFGPIDLRRGNPKTDIVAIDELKVCTPPGSLSPAPL